MKAYLDRLGVFVILALMDINFSNKHGTALHQHLNNSISLPDVLSACSIEILQSTIDKFFDVNHPAVKNSLELLNRAGCEITDCTSFPPAHKLTLQSYRNKTLFINVFNCLLNYPAFLIEHDLSLYHIFATFYEVFYGLFWEEINFEKISGINRPTRLGVTPLRVAAVANNGNAIKFFAKQGNIILVRNNTSQEN